MVLGHVSRSSNSGRRCSKSGVCVFSPVYRIGMDTVPGVRLIVPMYDLVEDVEEEGKVS